MEKNKIISKQTEKNTYKKSKTIGLLLITLFGVFFLSGMGLATNDFVGAGLLGGQHWFFWTVVAFVGIQAIVFSTIIFHWIKNGIPEAVIRSLYLYCWALLFVCAFVIGLQSATFGALNAQVTNFGFANFGNLFSIIWIVLIAFVTGAWIYAGASKSHLDEHRYKVLRNYFFWMIAFNLFIFHFEQASSGALGVDTEKMLLNTDLGDTIASSLTWGLSQEEAPVIIGQIVKDNKELVSEILGKPIIASTPNKIIQKVINNIFDDKIWGNESLIVYSLINTLFGKGAFWGLNNSWSGWTIFVSVITINIGLSTYAYNRFNKNDVHNVDNPFFVLTPLLIIIFTIFMYSINAYIVTFINDGHLNPGIVGSHIGHLQQVVPDNATIFQIIQANWMFNILKYPVGDVFVGTYHGTWWWWTEWTISFVGLNVIIFGSLIKHWSQLKNDFIARKKAKLFKNPNEIL